MTTDDGTLTDVLVTISGDWQFDGVDTVPDYAEVELLVGKDGNWDVVGTSGLIGRNRSLGNAAAGGFSVTGSVTDSSHYSLDDFASNRDGNSVTTTVYAKVRLSLGEYTVEYELTGAEGDEARAGSSSAGWVLDRNSPKHSPSYEQDITRETLDGEDMLALNVDSDGPTSGFYDNQGLKYAESDTDSDWHVGDDARQLVTIYVDPTWETQSNQKHRFGFWFTTGRGGDPSDYNIVTYLDSQAASQLDNAESDQPGFYYWDPASVGDGDGVGDEYDIEYQRLGMPSDVNPQDGGLVTLEFIFHPRYGVSDRLYANGELLKEDPLPPSQTPREDSTKAQYFMNTIVQSVNFGRDEQYLFDDFTLLSSSQVFEAAEQSTTFDVGVTNEGATISVGGSGNADASGQNEDP
ncbi:hypothetical protein DVK02_03605 [Halobellus sp. Atlit-31R]|nr:hypothetical protein DVK02_03605 [Halobellus sp. Atlit-31R]